MLNLALIVIMQDFLHKYLVFDVKPFDITEIKVEKTWSTIMSEVSEENDYLCYTYITPIILV